MLTFLGENDSDWSIFCCWIIGCGEGGGFKAPETKKLITFKSVFLRFDRVSNDIKPTDNFSTFFT